MYVVLPYWFQMLYFHHLMCPSVWLLIQLPQWGGHRGWKSQDDLLGVDLRTLIMSIQMLISRRFHG